MVKAVEIALIIAGVSIVIAMVMISLVGSETEEGRRR